MVLLDSAWYCPNRRAAPCAPSVPGPSSPDDARWSRACARGGPGTLASLTACCCAAAAPCPSPLPAPQYFSGSTARWGSRSSAALSSSTRAGGERHGERPWQPRWACFAFVPRACPWGAFPRALCTPGAGAGRPADGAAELTYGMKDVRLPGGPAPPPPPVPRPQLGADPVDHSVRPDRGLHLLLLRRPLRPAGAGQPRPPLSERRPPPSGPWPLQAAPGRPSEPQPRLLNLAGPSGGAALLRAALRPPALFCCAIPFQCIPLH